MHWKKALRRHLNTDSVLPDFKVHNGLAFKGNIDDLKVQVNKCLFENRTSLPKKACVPYERITELERKNKELLDRYRQLVDYPDYVYYGPPPKLSGLITASNLEGLVLFKSIDEPSMRELLRRELMLSAHFINMANKNISLVERMIFLAASSNLFTDAQCVLEAKPEIAPLVAQEILYALQTAEQGYNSTSDVVNLVNVLNSMFCSEDQWMDGLRRNCFVNDKSVRSGMDNTLSMIYQYAKAIDSIYRKQRYYQQAGCEKLTLKMGQELLHDKLFNLHGHAMILSIIKDQDKGCQVYSCWLLCRARYKMLYAFTVAVKQKIPPCDMPRFITENPYLFLDPISGKQMAFDEITHEIQLPDPVGDGVRQTLKYAYQPNTP
jgi:hypothetical protein